MHLDIAMDSQCRAVLGDQRRMSFEPVALKLIPSEMRQAMKTECQFYHGGFSDDDAGT
jgi:hypothetical protein